MKLVYYHPIAIQDKHPFQRVVNPLISVLDRTEKSWPDYDYLNLFPMPAVPSGTVDFYQTAVNRVKEIVADGGHITILWSGGIDSTFIMALMIDLGVLEELKVAGRLTIGLNGESIKENPVFFEEWIKRSYMECVVQADKILQDPQNYGVIITGEMADNLVGSLTMKTCVDYYNDFSIVHKPWSHAVDWLGRNLEGADKTVLSNFIDAAVEQSPVEISTSHDLLWYLNFNFKWQAVNFRIVSHARNPETGNALIRGLTHFFNTVEFQRWSMAEGHIFTGNSWHHYKMPLKKVILDVTGDRDYFNFKTKWPSLPALLRYKDTYDFIYLNQEDGSWHFTKTPVGNPL